MLHKRETEIKDQYFTIIYNQENIVHRVTYLLIIFSFFNIDAKWEFPTPPRPTLGDFKVFPHVGFACTTKFQLQGQNWVSLDNHSTFFYQFSYFDEDSQSEIIFNENSLSNKLETTLPHGNPDFNYSITLLLTVRDIYGSASRITQQVQVYPIQTSEYNLNQAIYEVTLNLQQADITSSNSMIQCLAIENEQLENNNEELIATLLHLIYESLAFQCSPITIRNQIRSLKYLSFSEQSAGHISKYIRIFSQFVSCFTNSVDESFFDGTVVASNLFHFHLNSYQSHEIRCFVEILRILRSSDRVCGEMLDDILTDNIRTQSRISFSNQLRNSDSLQFSFENDEISSISILSSTLLQISLPSCVVSDFAIYSVDVYNLDDDE